MTTYFARHTKKIDIDQVTRKALWEGRWIAIHYPRDKEGRQPEDPENGLHGMDNISWDPEDYPRNAKNPLRALKELAKHGGYVCATYENYDRCLVGYVAPNSPLELIDGTRGALYTAEGRHTFLKGVRFQRAEELDPRQHPLIFVGAPQQTTLTRWVCVQNRIEDLVEKRTSEPSLSTLTDAELETLCAEFLRTSEARRLGLPRLEMLLLPVGRTMKGIDIYGIADDGKTICAQVTYGISKSSQKKKEMVLCGYGSTGMHCVCFGSYESVEAADGIVRCPISTVYDYFSQTPHGRGWIHYLQGSRKGITDQ